MSNIQELGQEQLLTTVDQYFAHMTLIIQPPPSMCLQQVF